MVELPVVDKPGSKTSNLAVSAEYFDKTSHQVARLVNKSWFCRYPHCKHVAFDNDSEFKLYFRQLVESYGLEKKLTTIKNPQANSVLERVHQVFGNMLRTSELDMADSVNAESVSYFIDNAVWAICTTYYTVLKSSPGAAIFGRDMLFDISYLADWNKIGENSQAQTDHQTLRKNASRVDLITQLADTCWSGKMVSFAKQRQIYWPILYYYGTYKWNN
jgi:hypothetical protein